MLSKMSLLCLFVMMMQFSIFVSGNSLFTPYLKKATNLRVLDCSTAVPCSCEGYYSSSSNAKCTACSDGTWSTAGAQSCTPCPANYACTQGSKTACSTGTYSAVGSSTCSACADGYINSATQCKACAFGLWSTDHITCSACQAGFACFNGKKVSCVAGSASSAGSDRCLPCGNSYYSVAVESTQCTPCPAGQTSITPYTECIDCISGYSCPYNGKMDQCTGGSYALQGSAACSPCSAGYYSGDYGASACTICPTNTYSTGGATACTACALGQLSGSGASVCTGTAIISPSSAPATSPVVQSSSGSSSGGGNMGAAIGAAIAVALVLLCCIFFGYRWYHKRGSSRSGTFKNWGENENALNSEY